MGIRFSALLPRAVIRHGFFARYLWVELAEFLPQLQEFPQFLKVGNGLVASGIA